jgi:hypothetical protein
MSFTIVFLVKYYSIDQIKKNELGGHAAHMGEGGDSYGGLVEKPEGKRSLETAMRRLKDDIKMDLQAIGFGTGLGLD